MKLLFLKYRRGFVKEANLNVVFDDVTLMKMKIVNIYFKEKIRQRLSATNIWTTENEKQTPEQYLERQKENEKNRNKQKKPKATNPFQPTKTFQSTGVCLVR